MDVTGLTAADLKGRTPDELEAIAGAVDDELRDSFTVDGAVRNLSDGEHSEFTRLIDVRDAALKRAERSRAIEAVWRAHRNAVESASFPGPESRDRDRDARLLAASAGPAGAGRGVPGGRVADERGPYADAGR